MSLFNNVLYTIIFCLLNLASLYDIQAQSLNHATGAPSVASADGMNYSKYADIPVHHSTGTSSFSVPITSLSEGTIATGVSLSYHSAGIRVAEVSSPIGLGWNLNAGGIITRQIQGISDDEVDGFYHTGSFVSASPEYLDNVVEGDNDSESDIYSYSFGGVTGKFVFDSDGEIHLIPINNIKIEPYVHPNDGNFLGFIAKTPDGTTYYFGQHPSELTRAIETIAPVTIVNDVFVPGSSSTTSWYLVKIESYDQNHEIDFGYNNNHYQFLNTAYCSDVAYIGSGGQTFTNSGTSTPDCDNEFIYEIQGSILKNITTSTQTVTFNYFLNREDLLEPSTNESPKAINQIVVENGDDFCVEYNFTQSYFTDNTPASFILNHKRLKLDTINKKACHSNLSEPAWSFDYYGNGVFPHYLDKDIDHWGFSNNLTNNTTNNTNSNIIPNTSLTTDEGTFTYGSANRNSSGAAMLEGMLQKVNYPTKGGYTEFEYEANTYWGSITQTANPFNLVSCSMPDCCTPVSDENNLNVTEHIFNTGTWKLCFEPIIPVTCSDEDGPLIILEVIDGNNNVVITKNFNTSISECINGNVRNLEDDISGEGLNIDEAYFFKITSQNGTGRFTIDYDDFTTADDITCGGLRIKKVTTHDGIDPNKDIIRSYEYTSTIHPDRSSGILYNEPQYAFNINEHSVLFTSSSVLPLGGFSGYHIAYRRVLVHHNGNGMQEFNFNVEDDVQIYDDYPIVPSSIRVEDGSITTQRTHKGNSLNANATLTEVTAQSVTRYANDFSYPIEENLTAYKAQRLKIYDGSNVIDFDAFVKYIPREDVYRVGTVESTLDNVTTTTTYDYLNADVVLSPRRISSVNSDGETFRKDIYYTTSYPDNTPLRNDLLAANHTGIPFRTDIFHNGNQIDGQFITYSYFDGNGNPTTNTSVNDFPKPHTIERYTRTWEDGVLQTGNYTLQSTIKQYYPNNGLVKSVQQDGWAAEETIEYNSNKLPIRKSYIDHDIVMNYYLNSSMVQSTTAIDGSSMDYTYDELMRLKTSTNCKGVVTTQNYYFVNNDNNTNPLNLDYVESIKDYSNTTDSNNPNSAINTIQSRVYKDGLGRAIETVLAGQAPNGSSDIILAVEYDKQGRVIRKYEPQEIATNSAAFVPINPSSIPTEQWVSTFSEYYPSPLNRIQQVTPPNWDYPTKYEYTSNSVGDMVAIDGSSTAVYGANLLHKNIITDGNDNKSITYTDKKGRTILSRHSNSSQGDKLDTYTIYDDKDRPEKVLPPGTTLTNSDLIYEYEYDGEDKITKKKIPGKELLFYRYNSRDLVEAYQDDYLRNNALPIEQAYVYEYDDYGRELNQGFYDLNNNDTFNDVNFSLGNMNALLETTFGTQSHNKDKVTQGRKRILNPDGSLGAWLTTNNTYANTSCRLLTNQSNDNHLDPGAINEQTTFTYDAANYITNTNYLHITPSIVTTIKSESHFDHIGRHIKEEFGAGTGSLRTLCEKTYDEKNQLKTMYQGGFGSANTPDYLQKIDYTYLENGLLSGINKNLTGTTTGYVGCNVASPNPYTPNQSDPDDDKDLFNLNLYYDNPVSGTTSTSQKNGNISDVSWQVRGREVEFYSLNYDVHDRLIEAKSYTLTNNSINATGNYDVSMSYDARGNIQTLSRNGVYQDDNNCWVSGQIDDLKYQYHTGTNQIQSVQDIAPSGNCVNDISLTIPINEAHLSQANNSVNSSSTINNNATSVYFFAGNEINLSNGFEVNLGSTFCADIRDCGNGNSLEGFTENNPNNNDYLFDGNGNLSEDPNKGITIMHNHLDLPTIITFEDGRKLEFTYDAAGNMLTKTAKNANGSTAEKRDYINGVEYLSEQLESIYHSQGRIYFVGGTRYEYVMRDHLGNTRLTYSDLNNDGVIETPTEILQETHFYPYGMPKKGPWMKNLNNPMAYQFNGIEKVDNFGLGVDMAFYRTLDPELGIWWGVDPYAEAFAPMSPYCAMGASPMVYNDPDGGWVHIAVGAVIGGAINVATHWGDIQNGGGWGAGLAAFGIGAAGGALTAATGAGIVGAGALPGFAIGAGSSMLGDAVTQTGNAIAFNDQFSPQQNLMAGLSGGVMGGITGYYSVPAGVNPWTGQKLPPALLSTNGLQTISINGRNIEVPGLEVAAQQPAGGLDIASAKASGLYSGKITNYSNSAAASTKLLTAGRFPRLDTKYLKHVGKRAEWSQWGSLSKEAYYNRAVNLADSSVGGHIKGFTSKQGWNFRYNARTGEFLTTHPTGYIETFFRPAKGMNYYLTQFSKYGN